MKVRNLRSGADGVFDLSPDTGLIGSPEYFEDNGIQGYKIQAQLQRRITTVTLMASVQPLLKLTESQPAQIMSVPVLGQRLDIGGLETVMRPVLRAGDIVFIVCADAEIKNTLSGMVATPDSKRRHSRNDAVIVGVMPCSL